MKHWKFFRFSKAQTVTTLVFLVSLLVTTAVILYFVYPAIETALKGAGEKGACEWSLVMHSISKLGDWSLIPPECRAHRFEITMNDLEQHKEEAKKRIKTYHDPKTKHKYKDKIRENYPNPDKDIYWQEWSLNKIVAEEMKDCWEKVFKGRLPLFDKWWRLYSFPWQETGKPGEGQLIFKSFFGTFHQAPVNCIVCSRIKFSDELKTEFGSRININSLDTWLKSNYPQTGGKSYYESLAEGQSELKGLFVPPYEYSIDEPLAVLYEKIHYYHGADVALTGVWDYLFGDLSETSELDYLKLVPYTQERIVGQPVLKNNIYHGEACTFILD